MIQGKVINMITKRPLMPHIGVGALSSPLEVGADRAPKAEEALAHLLEELGCKVLRLGSIDSAAKSIQAGRKLAEEHIHAVVFASASWFEDYLVLDLLEECNIPVFLWSLPGMETGALCGSQQLTAYLKQLEVPYECVYGDFSNQQCVSRTKKFVSAAVLKCRLRRAKIGLGGYRVAGMTEVAANEFLLKKSIGPRIIYLDMPQVLERTKEISDVGVESLWKDVLNRVGKCQISAPEGCDSMKVYLALKEQVEKYDLDALTIGCYPHLMGRVCLASSLLADEGIPLGCEGDINGAVGQLMLTLLSRQPTHNTDWLEPLEDGTVIFTHCGSGSFSLSEKKDDIILSHVRLMNQGVCALFPARPGHVTLLSLIPRGDRYQIAMLKGEAIQSKMVFPGNPLRARFAKPTDQIIDWIHEKGIGHHWMAGYGDVCQEIRDWASMIGENIHLIEF